ncbi:MAG: hypothetical protein ACR2QW_01330 [bacterium]
MKLVVKLVSSAILSLFMLSSQASEEAINNTPNDAADYGNPFNWFSGFTGGTSPDAVTMEFHPMKPDSWARMVSPQSHMQLHMAMTNPANYAQYMNPAFYMEFMNPNNWMAWMNPASFQVFMDPSTMTWWMNPASYMHMMDPNMYAQLWNLNSYAQLMAPENYMAWMNPATYTNFMNPEMYMASTGDQTSEASADSTEQTTEDETTAE